MIIDDPPARGKGVLFRMVPDTMTFDTRRIKDTDIRLWCVLAHHARFRGYCTSTNAQLADTLGVSVPTVQRSLLRLVKAGYIDRLPDGEGRRIVLNPEGDGAQMPTIQVVG
jgi:CRP-like cAMP-binding protein